MAQKPVTPASSAAAIISDPDDIVDGFTIRHWAENYLTEAFSAPGGLVNPLHDVNGAAAVAFNSAGGKMYFITSAPKGLPPRSFDVPLGKDVLVPIAFVEDTEAKGSINPTIPGFNGSDAAQVRQVMATSHFADISLSIDGKPVSHLEETTTGIFSAGVVKAGSVAQDFFGAPPGTSLATTAEEGYFAVLKGLSRGSHTIVSTSSFNSQYLGSSPLGSHTDIINVV